jgi:hypothetical protein
MSRERVRRIERIASARKQTLDSRQLELARSARNAEESRVTAERARAELDARVGLSQPRECSSADLVLEHAYRTSLEQNAERLAARARQALLEEKRARQQVHLAKMEHTKLEKLRERLLDGLNEEERRQERLQADATALRIARQG